MKQILLFLLIPVFCCGQIPNKDFIKKIATKYRDNKLWIAIPVINHGKKIHVIINNTRLYNYYLAKVDKSKFLTFSDYLTTIVKVEPFVTISELGLSKENIINDNSAVIKLYKEKGLKSILENFLHANTGDYLTIKNGVDKKDIYALILIMFSNNYYVSLSDYTGYFNFHLKG
jgi:hypothetical protein